MMLMRPITDPMAAHHKRAINSRRYHANPTSVTCAGKSINQWRQCTTYRSVRVSAQRTFVSAPEHVSKCTSSPSHAMNGGAAGPLILPRPKHRPVPVSVSASHVAEPLRVVSTPKPDSVPAISPRHLRPSGWRQVPVTWFPDCCSVAVMVYRVDPTAGSGWVASMCPVHAPAMFATVGGAVGGAGGGCSGGVGAGLGDGPLGDGAFPPPQATVIRTAPATSPSRT